MAILVDPATWPAHGRLWCHLVSDSSVAELHAFAEHLGLPRRAFDRDHYDIPEDVRPRVLADGGEDVPARELVRRLTAGGLRRRRTVPPEPGRVVLMGLMGAGKSTVGRAFAKETGWAFLDNDRIVEQLAGMPTPAASLELGASGLHDVEIEALRKVVRGPAPCVAGAAASVVDGEVGRALLREAYTVYLSAPLDVLVDRVSRGRPRPWLELGPRELLSSQLELRHELFVRSADLVLDVAHGRPSALADRILSDVQRRGGMVV